MDIIVSSIVNQHPEYTVCPNYEELVLIQVKKENYKDITIEEIKVCLHNLNSDLHYKNLHKLEKRSYF